MDLSFLSVLGALKEFPSVGLLAVVAVLLFTGRLMPSSAAAREIDRANTAAEKEAVRIAADRDARLQSKDEEIARTNAAHDAEVARARQAETEWREAWRESQDIAAEVRSQNRDLVDSLYFVRKVVGSLPGATEGGDKT